MKRIIFLVFIIIVFLSCSEPDACERVTCQNGGVCIEGNCECPDGYVGAFCQNIELDPCLEITCPYDGGCMEGECICTELTQNYIIGSWLFENTTYLLTFNADGSFIDTGGHEHSYVLNTSSRIIELYELNGAYIASYNILLFGFSCEKLNLGTSAGVKTNTLIRQ